MSAIDKHIGRRLSERCAELGLTLEELAAQIQVSRVELAGIMQGRRRAGADFLLRACAALEVGPRYFFAGLELDKTEKADLSNVVDLARILRSRGRRRR